jgi:hypothetical protein
MATQTVATDDFDLDLECEIDESSYSRLMSRIGSVGDQTGVSAFNSSI